MKTDVILQLRPNTKGVITTTLKDSEGAAITSFSGATSILLGFAPSFGKMAETVLTSTSGQLGANHAQGIFAFAFTPAQSALSFRPGNVFDCVARYNDGDVVAYSGKVESRPRVLGI